MYGAFINFDDDTGELQMHHGRNYSYGAALMSGFAPGHSTWLVRTETMPGAFLTMKGTPAPSTTTSCSGCSVRVCDSGIAGSSACSVASTAAGSPARAVRSRSTSRISISSTWAVA